MVSSLSWIRYAICKLQHTHALGYKNYKANLIKDEELGKFMMTAFAHGTLTFLHWNKGEEMAPTIPGKGATLLVRQLPIPDPSRVFVGDVVVLKNPETPDNFIVRRLAAIEGYEMASTDEKEESFVLEKNHCWVVAENEKLKAKEAIDSRTFGPVHMTNIIGRVLYCLRSAVDHGRVQNSHFGMQKDSPVLDVELNVDEMIRSHKDNLNSEDH